MAEPTYDFYRNTYLDTHTKLVQQSILMAQQEFDSKLKQIQFYEKQPAKMKYGSDGSGSLKFADRASLQYRAQRDVQKDIRDERTKVEQESQLDQNFVAIENNIKSLIGGGKSPEQAVKQVIQEMQLNKAGESDYQSRLIAQRLVQVTGSAARAKGRTPSAAGINQAVETGMGIGGFQKSAAKLKQEEITRRTKDLEPIPVPGSRTFKTGKTGSGSNLEFSMDEVFEDKDGLFFRKPAKKKGDPDERVPLTVEQERVYRLQKKIRKLETNLEQDYGEDYSIDTIIEKGRDIYRRNYAPISNAELQDIYRQNFLDTLSERQQGLFLAYETVDANDRRVKNYLKGNYDKEDSFYAVVDQIVQAKKQGQDVDPIQLATEVLGDADLAKEAVGVVLRAQIAEMKGKEIKPSKEQEDKSKRAKRKKEEVSTSITEADDELASMSPDLKGLAKFRDKVGDAFSGFFADRMKDEVKEEVTEEVKGLEEPDEMPADEIPKEPTPVVEEPKAPVIPLNTNLVNKKTYNYQVASLDADGNPVFVFVNKDGVVKPGVEMNADMIAEAQKGLDKILAEQAGQK
mgnify:CR=1 FL=1